MTDHSIHAATTFLDSWLGYRARNVDIPGFSVAIWSKDKIVFSKAYGLANLERVRPLTTDVMFVAASHSKMFTMTAILQLVERNKLRLDDAAQTHLPWLKEHKDHRVHAITIRQLLSHSAGLIRDGLDTDFWILQKPFPTDQEVREMTLAADLAIEPNTVLKYSNLGFGLLGQIITTVSGLPFTEYVTRHIIRPLHLQDTFADYSPELNGRLVTAYGVPFEHIRPVLELRTTTGAFAPVVGVHGTPEDMCRFASAHCFGNTTLLSDESKREAQRTQWCGTGYDSGYDYGLGFEIQRVGERRIVGHGAHLAGCLSATYFDPKEDLIVSVMANCKDAPSTQIVRGIFEALDWFKEFAADKPVAKIQRLNARLCSPTSVVEVVAASERIVLIDPDDWEPFTFGETCEQIDPTTLKITTPGSVFNAQERLRYSFKQGVAQSVRYAGATFLSESIYKQRLRGV